MLFQCQKNEFSLKRYHLSDTMTGIGLCILMEYHYYPEPAWKQLNAEASSGKPF